MYGSEAPSGNVWDFQIFLGHEDSLFQLTFRARFESKKNVLDS